MWMLFGISAVVATLLNVVWYFINKNTEIFRFLSLSLTALTMCDFYSQSAHWLNTGDMSALLDVVPTMSSLCWYLVVISIIINGVTLIKRK